MADWCVTAPQYIIELYIKYSKYFFLFTVVLHTPSLCRHIMPALLNTAALFDAPMAPSPTLVVRLMTDIAATQHLLEALLAVMGERDHTVGSGMTVCIYNITCTNCGSHMFVSQFQIYYLLWFYLVRFG